MKILIKGAGDLATGIASRLYGAGHQILMTEIAQPLTVRRTVALSRAVYDRRAIVEEMEAVSAKTQEDAEAIMEEGKIPVIVDPKADCRKWYKPDVIVDAIIAKKNTGTKITDAPFVIGIGPGFTAGKDCHCVIETKRGHTLGSVIWEGSAIADTGVPGNIGGYTTERLIRASEDGIIEPKVRIGDIVEKGQIVAVTGGKPVFAQMGGIVRGMLQPGAYVKKNLKIGDIDARAERSHCETISDKARAIGGGALEAAERFEKIKGHYAVVILAAGKGTRFSGERGESKLHAKIDQKPMYMHMMDKMQAFSSVELFIVTGDEKIIEEAEKRGIFVVRNKEPEKGIAHSGRAGCIIRSAFLNDIAEAYHRAPGLSHLLLDEHFGREVMEALPAWKKYIGVMLREGLPVPVLSAALNYFLGLTTNRSPANMIQAMRDYFGAHTFERVDSPRGEFFHEHWEDNY